MPCNTLHLHLFPSPGIKASFAHQDVKAVAGVWGGGEGVHKSTFVHGRARLVAKASHYNHNHSMRHIWWRACMVEGERWKVHMLQAHLLGETQHWLQEVWEPGDIGTCYWWRILELSRTGMYLRMIFLHLSMPATYSDALRYDLNLLPGPGLGHKSSSSIVINESGMNPLRPPTKYIFGMSLIQ